MPGAIPGIPGAVAFIAFKFGGYLLAGKTLKRWHPTIMDSALKIAISRTVLGVVLGPLLSLGLVWIGSFFLGPSSDVPIYAFYPFLFVVRVFIWAIVIYYFEYGLGITRAQLWRDALLGAIWSSVLDVPGLFLAMIAPGRIGIC